MNDQYRQIKLTGKRVRQFFRESLKEGHHFSQQLLRDHDFDEGRVVAFLPTRIARPGSRRFEYGGIADSSESLSYLSREIRTWLLDGAVCVLENSLAKPHDRYLEKLKSGIAFFDDEVYHFIAGTATEDAIMGTIRAADTNSSLIGAVSFARSVGFGHRETLTKADLESLSRHLVAVIVEVFDGESFLIWEKHRPTPVVNQHLNVASH